MNRNFRYKLLFFLAGLLLIQPAVNAFSLEQAKNLIFQNFEVVKPYFTVKNALNSVAITGVLAFFGYVIYNAYNHKNFGLNDSSDEDREKEEPKPILSLNDAKAELSVLIKEIQEIIGQKVEISESTVRNIGEVNAAMKRYGISGNEVLYLSEAVSQLFSAIKDYNKALDLDGKEKEQESKVLDSAILNINKTCNQIKELIQGKSIDPITIENESNIQNVEDLDDDNVEDNDPILGQEQLLKKITRIKIIANLKQNIITQEDMRSIHSTIKPLNHCTLNEELARLFPAIKEYNKAIRTLPYSTEKAKIENDMAKAIKTINGVYEYMKIVIPLVIKK